MKDKKFNDVKKFTDKVFEMMILNSVDEEEKETIQLVTKLAEKLGGEETVLSYKAEVIEQTFYKIKEYAKGERN